MNKADFLTGLLLAPSFSYHPESFVPNKEGTVAQNKERTLAQRKAAVLVGLVERESGIHLIFTKRAKHLRHHPGQVSFPGGKQEESDASLAEAAFREAEEEIGIKKADLTLIGSLPSFPTRSQFLVTPVLAWVNEDYQPRLDENEVASLFEVPLDYLLTPNHLHSHYLGYPFYHRLFAIPYKNELIWGVTGQIIEALQKHIHRRT